MPSLLISFSICARDKGRIMDSERERERESRSACIVAAAAARAWDYMDYEEGAGR